MNDSYLTDGQYIRLLDKIERKLKDGEKAWVHDNTVPGNKYTTSSVGLCNDNLTERDMAMWPEDFPGRKSMRYKQDYHVCPFDKRLGTESKFWNGCYYTCRLVKENINNEQALDLVQKARDIFEERNVVKP